MRLSQLGWVLAAAFVGVAAGGGFRAKTDKTGFVDMAGLYDDSNLKKKNDDKLQSAGNRRKAALDFFKLNPEFTPEQLARFKELSIKDDPTPAETAELTKLKETVQAATNQFDELSRKPNPTPDELKRLNTLGALHDANLATQQQWGNDFTQQLDELQVQLDASAIDSIRAALAQVAKNQGYEVVFRENVAVYGANNLGPEVKRIVDKNAK